jgi:ribonuclease HI
MSSYLERILQYIPSSVRWKNPVQGVLKINVGASFRDGEMHGATGLVVRDHVGSLISAQALWYLHAASSMIMEATAIRDAVKFAMERNYHRVEIESDNQGMAKQMKEPGIGRSKIASIAREVKELCNFLASFSITYVGRTANEAAHSRGGPKYMPVRA